MNFFDELRRRNVVRVGVAYLVVGWLLLQVVGTVAPGLGWPEWVMSFFIVLIAVGFPIALLLSWAFELTPSGVKKTEEVDRDSSISHHTGQKLNYVIIAALVLALGYFVWESRFQSGEEGSGESVAAVITDKTIAVLPFVNLSSDPEQEYFSDGMTEEILNALAKIRELRVAARTSAFAYKGQNLDLRTVGQELGVKHIMEGSVRKAGNTVRITAQLIEVDTGFHLWSETYDRNLDNIFAIQEEISLAIAEALSITLDIADTPVITGRTENLEAYDLYLRSLVFYRRRENMLEAERLLNAAIALDSNFAAAWASLAQVLDIMHIYVRDLEERGRTAESLDGQARFAAEKAVELAPNLPKALHAMGEVLFEYKPGFSRVEPYKYFLAALEIDPSNSDIMEDMVGALFSTGLTEQAVSLAERLTALDAIPVNLLALGMALTGDGQYERAIEVFESASSASPLGPLLWFGSSAFILSGKFEALSEYIEHFRDAGLDREYTEFRADVDLLLGSLTADGLVDPKIRHQITNPRIRFILDAEAGALAPWSHELQIDYNIQGGFAASWMYNDPRFASLRKSRSFKLGMRDMSNPEFWREYGWPRFCRPLGEDDFECGGGK